MGSKSIFASKTFWLGAAEMLLGAFDKFVTSEASNDPYFWVAAGLLTMAARFVTTQKVHVLTPPQ